ncbi:MAG: UDP-N-acetylmuramate dehydrogenase [Pseudomonadota bacterium]
MDLRPYNSFRVPARCQRLVRLEDVRQLAELTFEPERDLILGDGSNVLIAADVPGTVVLNRLGGRRIIGEDSSSVLIHVGAGEDWHKLVRWTLDRGLSGLENLSLIPGRTGAAPIQNIGAYGVELAEHLDTLLAWDWKRSEHRRLPADACDFRYRDSRFKSSEPDRFLVTGLELRLSRHFVPRLNYHGLNEELTAMGIETPNARAVSDAVIRLRRRKLPDPDQLGNAGSFFKNPVVDPATAQRLATGWPELPLYRSDEEGYKASAAWMIERCGWKGFREGDAGVSAQHALVLVNHGTATGSEIAALAARIRDSVQDRFTVRLEPEPGILNFRPG